ncbi:F-box/LRR-repeat protein 17-like protein [Drosera capensis]
MPTRHHTTATSSTAAFTPSPATPAPRPPSVGKKRGNYNCGLCGLPKKGHICTPKPNTKTTTPSIPDSLPPRVHRVPRALVFDDREGDGEEGGGDSDLRDNEDLGFEDDWGNGVLPGRCVWEVVRRLPPGGLVAAGGVCRGWRECSVKVWKAAEEMRLRVPRGARIGFVGSVLEKCGGGLVRLSLRIKSHVYATMLACVAFSCPNLESLEISTSASSVNRITGDELGRFVADKRCLATLKMEGCSNLGALVLSSSSLTTLWLSDLHSLPKMEFNCPSLQEISLHFSCQEKDKTDLVAMVDNMCRYCRKLQNIHIASSRLSNSVVLALTGANLRSSISDSGISMICNVFSQSLSKLLLAACPNVTSSGVQFATAQLPLLELMDCGMTIRNHDADHSALDVPKSKLRLIYQKLIVKHNRLRKLSLWGCSGLDALSLSCPKLYDLNLNSCVNLNPERLFLECPILESIDASGCQGELIEALRSQVDGDIPDGNHFTSKRMPDASKRIRIPHFIDYEREDDTKLQTSRKRSDNLALSKGKKPISQLISGEPRVFASLPSPPIAAVDGCDFMSNHRNNASPLLFASSTQRGGGMKDIVMERRRCLVVKSDHDSSKRWKSHLRGQSSLLFAPTRRATQLLVSGTRSNAHKGNILQVLCSKKSEVPVLEARFMYEVYDALAERLLPNAAAASYPNLKHIVGLAGPPGAGKSTVASEVVQRVNKLWPQKAPSFAEEVNSPDVATVLPMDGFHLYRHQLDAMEDPKEAHARRGAPWTFDPARLLKCLQTLRTQGYVYAPSFDHGVGDPIEDDIFVTVQ